MLDPNFKAKWIAALRSGDYPQTRGVLRDEDGYCCLGVACIAAGKEPTLNRDNQNDLYKWLNEQGVPSSRLWDMNDSSNKSFAEIADYIEAHL